MQQTKKKSILIVFIGALLLAGLFLFARQQSQISPENLKPSQLNFSESNELPKTAATRFTDATTESGPKATDQNEVPSKVSIALNKLQNEDLKKWQTFESILSSKNDNDPRIDQEFKHISSDLKIALMEKYATIPAESRNDRGLISFLVARDLNSTADTDFLKKVFEEPPCLSLADCKTIGPDDAHHSGINQTTLEYPKMAALYQIEKRLTEHPEILSNPSLREGIVADLRQAEACPVPMIQQKALQIRTRFQL